MAIPLSVDDVRAATPMAGGNVGEVFLLRNESRVLKMLRPELIDEAFVERFHAEVEHQERIDSDFVPRVLERGAVEGRPFFVMERHPGKTLEATLLEETPLSARDIGVGLLRAMADVHAAGVTHRDLKSDNVLVDASRVSILDFGAATLTCEGERTKTQVGSSICWGPERLEGFNGADRRSDLFAAGILLYLLVARAHPFAFGSPRWRDLLRSKAPPLRAFNPKAASLDPFFETALAPEVAKRFASAEVMSIAWQRACSSAPLG